MQTFLKSRTNYSSGNRQLVQRGFTLIELLISIAIITIITGIVLVRFSAFDSTIVLKNKAYEAGLILRELQVESVSVQRTSNVFDYSFGATFSPTPPSGPSTYKTFYFSTSSIANSGYGYPVYDTSICRTGNDWDCAHDLETFNMGNKFEISEVCYTDTGGEECSSDSARRVDVTFRRPEFTALMNTNGTIDGTGEPNSISNAKIKFRSKDSGSGPTYVVEVSKLGQISIYNE